MDGADPWGTDFNIPALLDLVPEPRGLTIDVGCGEGRVARQLESAGYRVVGIDGSQTLARAAGHGGLGVVLGDAAALPFRDQCGSITVSSMVLMDVDDLAGHLRELARVTAAGGSLCASILHPMRMAGFPLGDEHRTFAVGDYLNTKLQEWRFEKNGAPARLRFWQRPISDYINCSDGRWLRPRRDPRAPPVSRIRRAPRRCGVEPGSDVLALPGEATILKPSVSRLVAHPTLAQGRTLRRISWLRVLGWGEADVVVVDASADGSPVSAGGGRWRPIRSFR